MHNLQFVSVPRRSALQTADFGPKTALKIVDGLREGLKAGEIKTSDDIRAAIKQQIVALLEPAGSSSSSSSSELQLQGEPAVLLIVGVNGAGKTTTIGKLAHRLSKEGARVSNQNSVEPSRGRVSWTQGYGSVGGEQCIKQ
jgi:signal recognition particle GTPase